MKVWSEHGALEMRQKESFSSDLSSNSVLKGRFRKSWSDSSSSRKRAAKNLLFQLVGNRRPATRYSIVSDMDLIRKKEEISQAQELLLKRLEGSNKL